MDFPWMEGWDPPERAWMSENVLCAYKVIDRAYMAHVNGYVRLDETHPWRGIDYNELDVSVNGGLTFGARYVEKPNPEDYAVDDSADPELKKIRKLLSESTWRQYNEQQHEEYTYGWIGFDTGHGWDYWPDEELVRIGVVEFFKPENAEYRTLALRNAGGSWVWSLEKMVEEIEKLAAQVALARDLASESSWKEVK